MNSLKLKPSGPIPCKTFNFAAPPRLAPFTPQESSGAWRPAVEVAELEDQYVLLVDVPGMRAAEITVSVDADILSIAGERAVGAADSGEKLLSERPSGLFVRSLTLPNDAAREEMQATLSDGVLELRIPRIGWKTNPRS